MIRRILVGLAMLSLTTTIPGALAHGGKKHVMGTIESAEAGGVVVRERDGNVRTIRLTPGTDVRDVDGNAASISDLRPGDRVVVDLEGEGSDLEASDVRFSHPEPEEAGHAPE